MRDARRAADLEAAWAAWSAHRVFGKMGAEDNRRYSPAECVCRRPVSLPGPR